MDYNTIQAHMRANTEVTARFKLLILAKNRIKINQIIAAHFYGRYNEVRELTLTEIHRKLKQEKYLLEFELELNQAQRQERGAA